MRSIGFAWVGIWWGRLTSCWKPVFVQDPPDLQHVSYWTPYWTNRAQHVYASHQVPKICFNVVLQEGSLPSPWVVGEGLSRSASQPVSWCWRVCSNVRVCLAALCCICRPLWALWGHLCTRTWGLRMPWLQHQNSERSKLVVLKRNVGPVYYILEVWGVLVWQIRLGYKAVPAKRGQYIIYWRYGGYWSGRRVWYSWQTGVCIAMQGCIVVLGWLPVQQTAVKLKLIWPATCT